MHGILVSAAWTVLGVFVSYQVIKYFVFWVVYLLGGEAIDFAANVVLKQQGADPVGILGLFAQLPPGALYFMDLFYVLDGIKPLLMAVVSVWAMKRIPFFG
jgi:hypothetical protein